MFPMLHGIFGQGGIVYLLRDEFTTNASAPLSTPRTCEPGPGTLTIVDTSNSISVSGGKLVLANTGVTASALSDTIARAIGRAVIGEYTPINVISRVGWGPDSTTSGMVSSAPTQYHVQGFTLILFNPGSGLQYHANVMQSNFYIHIFAKPPGLPYITWISTPDASGRKVGIQKQNATASSEVDYIRVTDLPAPWSTDYGIADVHATPGVSGTDYTGQANAIIDLIVTAPGTLAGEAGYWFRKQDASNGYKAYFNNAGAFLVDRYVAGTPTNVVSVAGGITGSGTCTIRTIADGTALRFYTLSGTTWTQRGGTITDSNFSSQTTITPFADASWTGGGGSIGQLDSWPRTLSGAALAALNAV